MIPIISIIVPVYKVEKYLCRCLDSILAQTFTDFECILVDDCSPDNCPYICDEYAKKDSRITVIHKEKNMGLAAARASGLSKSVGEFIMHVDSDDWIELNALELLYKKQQETDADIVLGSMKTIYLYGHNTHINLKISTNIMPVSYFLLYGFYGLVAKLYKKSLFQGYTIPNMEVGEDLIVNAQIFSKIQQGKLQKINELVYYYDCTVNGFINKTKDSMKNLTSYLDSPHIKCRLWVEQYLSKMKQDPLVETACLYLVYEAMTQYAWRCKNITKNEIEFFYKNYHQKLVNNKYFKRMLFFRQIIIPIFYFSMPLGKTYAKALNFLESMKMRFGNFYSNLEKK
jgi:glycosyltransferase involved in cell wall biosynthesis